MVFHRKALSILTSPKTTLALGATLGTLLIGPAVVGAAALRGGAAIVGGLSKSFITRPLATTVGVVAAPFAVGLATTPEARRFFTGGFQRGKKAPKAIESLLEKGKEKVSGISPRSKAAAAAVVGGAAIVAGGTALAKAARAKVPTPTAPIGQLPTLGDTFQPLAPVKKPEEKVAIVEAIAPVKPMKIINTFNPTIDISFKKSKRFINQQINVRRHHGK